MSAPVTWMHRIVERDPTPLAIPTRPMPVVEFHELPDRLWTYRITLGSVVLGFVRHAPDGWWIARTLGSDVEAAELKRFADRHKAAQWLQQRVRR